MIEKCLEDTLIKEHIFQDHPFNRIKNGKSLPLIAISYPLFDEKEIFNERAWKGLKDLINETINLNPEHYSQNNFPLFINGGAIGNWRFMFSKSEGGRILQKGHEKNNFNQENLRMYKESLKDVNDKIKELPENVTVYYGFSKKDHENISHHKKKSLIQYLRNLAAKYNLFRCKLRT